MRVKVCTVGLIYLALLLCLYGVNPVAAQVVNGGFETGDYTGWTVMDGTAWGAGPSNGARTGKEGTWSADSHAPAAESEVGVLRSDNFTLTGSGLITFVIAGHNKDGGGAPPGTWNYVTLNQASDGLEVARVEAPGNDNFVSASFNGTGHVGESLYIEVVDNGDAAGFAWIAVDDFKFFTPPPPSGINGNGSFETGDYSTWNVISGTCWGSGPSAATRTGTDGYFHADSHGNGALESDVGVLRSNSFTLTGSGKVGFLIAGHNKDGGGPPPGTWNYVTLNRASDSLEIARVEAPGNDSFAAALLDGGAYTGVPVYIEVVDNGDAAGFAWIAVDYFRELPGFPAGGINGNGNFEKGTFEGWTVVEGDAWGTGPILSAVHSQVTGVEGLYYADSFPLGEAATGILRSNSFVLSKEAVSVKIAGHDHWPDTTPAHSWNYVALKLAGDGTEIARVWAPGDNAFATVLLEARGRVGQSVYVEAVDDGADAAYAWMAIDDVKEVDPPPLPSTVFDDFESGTLDPSRWTLDNDTWKALEPGQGWGAAPLQGGWRAASSYDGAASNDAIIGSMTSVPISVGAGDGWLGFYMQGWDSMTGGAGQNYVDITTVDGTLIQRVLPPLKDGWQLDIQVPVVAYRGQQIRMVCVDGRSDGFGWIGVDYIRLIPGNPTSVDDWLQY